MTRPRGPAPVAVLLDLGNVLVFHDNALLSRRLAERAGVPVEQVDAALTPMLWEDINRGKVAGDQVRTAVGGALNVAWTAEEFFALWNCHFQIHHQVLAQVEALASRVKLVLLSNTNALHFRYLRPLLPVLEHFHALVLSHEVGAVKPEPAIYLEALARAGCAPEQATFFDDIAAYAQAACELGIQGRVFTTAEDFRRQCDELGLS